MQTLKKWSQWIVAFVAMVLVLAGFSPLVQAQEQSLDLQTLITNIQEANKEIESMGGNVDADLNVEIPDVIDLAIKAQGDFQYNVSPRFAGMFVGSADVTTASPVLDENGNTTGEMEETTENYTLDATVVDGVFYGYDGSAWTVEDISEEEQEISQAVTDAMQEAQTSLANGDVEKVLPLYEQYFDITQTDTEYIFTLKDGIDKEAFWNDLESIAGVNFREEEVNQVEAEFDQAGETFTPEEREQFKTIFSNILDTMLDLMSNVVVTYDATTYKLIRTEFNMNATSEDIANVLESIADPQDIPAGIVIDIAYVVNFFDHGQQFEIVAPADAPKFEESSDESAEETTEESVETESAAESASEETESSTEESATESTETSEETDEAESTEESSEN